MVDLTTPAGIALAFRAGRTVPESAFDAFLPPAFGAVSERFWTPLTVARCAVRWLDELGVGDVCDLGAGVGKWCVAAALVDSSRRRYLGLEHRPALVDAAAALAETFGVADRVQVMLGTVADLANPAAPPAFAARPAAYYLFNPYGENVAPDDEHLDATVELTDARFARDIGATESLLALAPDGTYALVYNGFGGRVPMSYEPIRIDYDLPNVLRLWVKLAGPVRSNRWPR